jgi:flagellin-specific chaperone FliS
MLIAREKRKTNIAEYLLYMWQVEDTIRACDFDMEIIEKRIISQFTEVEKVKSEIRDWYANLILMMHEEGIREKGHLSLVQTMTDDLYQLHRKLLYEKQDEKYLEQYSWAAPNIREFSQKLNGQSSNEIETCLYGLYALLLLRLQKKEISNETREAMQTFSNLLAVLSERFKQIETGKAEF